MIDDGTCYACPKLKWHEGPCDFSAPSTPAPQGEKCAHAPEIPEDPRVQAVQYLRDQIIGFNTTRTMYAGTLYEIAVRAFTAESTLARERESRKQAEAALREARRFVKAYCGPESEELAAIDAVLKPVQEPAERERGK